VLPLDRQGIPPANSFNLDVRRGNGFGAKGLLLARSLGNSCDASSHVSRVETATARRVEPSRQEHVSCDDARSREDRAPRFMRRRDLTAEIAQRSPTMRSNVSFTTRWTSGVGRVESFKRPISSTGTGRCMLGEPRRYRVLFRRS